MSQQPNPSKRELRETARSQRLEREQAAAAGEARRKRLLQLGGLLAVAAVLVIVAVLVSSGGGKKSASSGGSLQGTAATKSLLDGLPQSGITLGKANAPVTIVEFADPQCPFCKDYTLKEMPAIVQKYVRTGKAKMELRFMTFIGPDSVTAAHALEGAGAQNKLWNATDLFYRNQGAENSGYVTDAFMRKVLSGAGANADHAIKQGGTPAVAQELGAVTTLASRYAVDSTPTILVGPTGGTLKKDTEAAPTAAGVGKLVDAAAGKSGA